MRSFLRLLGLAALGVAATKASPCNCPAAKTVTKLATAVSASTATATVTATAVVTVTAAAAAAPSEAAVTVLHSFGLPSWAENMAIRPNGQILITRLDAPAVYQVDPDTGDATLVYSWNATAYKGALGISETTTDKFYVITSAFVDSLYEKTSGTNAVWEVDMSTFAVADGVVTSNATVSHLADVPEADFLNGMTTLDESHVLVADIHRGIVFKVNTQTAAHAIVIDDPLMKYSYYESDPATHLGCNGLKIHGGHLYFTNTAAGFLARVPIDSGGGPTGASSIAVTNVPRADDFIIRERDGAAFIAQNQWDTLSLAYLENGSPVVATPIAGSNTSTTLAGVTAAKFGRRSTDSTRLYLSTSGGLALPINGTVTVAGTVSYIDSSAY